MKCAYNINLDVTHQVLCSEELALVTSVLTEVQDKEV